MNILIIGDFHHKNKEGLERLLKYLNYDYKVSNNLNDINNYDIIYSPNYPIDTSKYPDKKFIFGPHFSVFPDNKLMYINNVHNNSIYIQPSDWVCELWRSLNAENIIPLKSFAFPVNTEQFNDLGKDKSKVFIYYKSRKPEELKYIESFLTNKNIEYQIFDYVKRYDENNYIRCLQESKYGIWVGRHESQGFALQEALSMNIPLLVWNVKSMNQEENINYPEIFGTVIPYWDERCGEYFYEQNEFIQTYDKFINKLNTYKPREYVLDNLSIKKCAKRFNELITSS
jgi:hypothetical protein